MNRMYRSSRDMVFAGVCAAVADFFGLDVKLVRLVWLAAALFGAGVALYLILWFLIPEN